MPISLKPGGSGGSSGGGSSSGGGGGGPHSHDIGSPYGDVQTWERAGTSVFADNQMYRTGIEVDQDETFLHIGLITSGDSNPAELVYERIRISEWAALPLDTSADAAGFDESSNLSGLIMFGTDDRFNTISIHLRRYRTSTSGPDLLSIGGQLASDQPSGGIRGIKYFYETPISATDEASGGGSSGGGGGGVSALIDPKTSYGAADVGKFTFEGGALKKVEVDPHPGHSKEVVWIDVSEGEGGVTNTNFRGFHQRPGAVHNPVAGNFYAATGYGDFEVYRTLGTTGWYSYNPFEAGEPWASVEDDNGTDVSIATVTVNGETRYWQVVHSRQEAFNAVTAEGQAFFVLDDTSVIVATEFVAFEADETEYRAKIYAPRVNNPRAYFWLKGQTERFTLSGGDYDVSPSGGTIRLAFDEEDPNESYDDPDNLYEGVMEAATGSSIDSGGGSLADYMLMDIPPGRHDILVEINSDATDSNAPLFLMKVQSGTDDVVTGYSEAFRQQGAGTGAIVLDNHYFLMLRDFVAEDGDKYYLRITGIGANDFDLNGYAMFEYRGDA